MKKEVHADKTAPNAFAGLAALSQMALRGLGAVYAFATDVRNWMFDHGWLRERSFDVPTICVGNLAVGGTGKTPHCEWLVQHLLDDGRCVAILSRGYGRKTRGYLEGTPASRAEDIGDEPLQMLQRFGDRVHVAVCEDRCRGIEQLTERHPQIDVIVMDDAFQHRYVRPTSRILLTAYNRLYDSDHVMPAGRLRERAQGAQRADIIIVTKCPSALSAAQRNAIMQRLAPIPHQQVFFTSIAYADSVPSADVLLITGIAHPEPLVEHLTAHGTTVSRHLAYRDHHAFTAVDVNRIEEAAQQAEHIITTAKDFQRMRDLPLSAETRRKITIQDIHVSVLDNDDERLYRAILSTLTHTP